MGQRTKVTKGYIDGRIRGVSYIRRGTLMVCIIEIVNGFQITGVSACVDPNEFDMEIGKNIAYNNAFNKVWELEGYLLSEEKYQFNVSLKS